MIATVPLISDHDQPDDRDGLDPWTGLPGETFWRLVVTAESARGVRYGRVSSVVLMEVVGLDDRPRASGMDRDTIVVRLAQLLRSSSRTSDLIADLGRGRFGILLTETSEVAAINMVERVRDRCEQELSRLAPGAHVAFGWASPSGGDTLLGSTTTAESRLRRETARLVAESD